jgi:hypothetical protein
MSAAPLTGVAHGGFVADLQTAFGRSDYPVTRLYRMAEGDPENNFGMRRLFPEMVDAYQRRSFIQWRHLWDTIPGRATFGGAEWCFNPLRCKESSRDPECKCHLQTGEGLSHCHFKDIESELEKDENCGAKGAHWVQFIFLHEIQEWIPAVLLPEYRLLRMRQKRLNRLLYPMAMRWLYSCPNGVMFRKTAETTMVGRSPGQ